MNRTDIPEIRRPREGRLQVMIPWCPGGNRALLGSVCGSRSRLEWDGTSKRWLVARAYFAAVIETLKTRFGEVRVITWHRDAERCDVRCQKAKGFECTCSCGGRCHAGENAYARGWRLVSDTQLWATGWTERVWIVSAGGAEAQRAA